MATLDAAREQAIANVTALAKRYDALSADLAAVTVERDDAIRLAAEFGISQSALAAHTGVTRPRIAQIVAAGRDAV